MLHARPDELWLAILSMFAATGEGPRTCADFVDQAVRTACTEDDKTLIAAGIVAPTAARFGATRVINSLCGACRACPRGQDAEAEALTPEHPRAA